MLAADFQIGECFSLHNPGEPSGWYMVIDKFHWEFGNTKPTKGCTLECQSAEGILMSKIRGDMKVLGRVEPVEFVAAERRWERRRDAARRHDKIANLKEGDTIINVKTGDRLMKKDGTFISIGKE